MKILKYQYSMLMSLFLVLVFSSSSAEAGFRFYNKGYGVSYQKKHYKPFSNRRFYSGKRYRKSYHRKNYNSRHYRNRYSPKYYSNHAYPAYRSYNQDYGYQRNAYRSYKNTTNVRHKPCRKVYKNYQDQQGISRTKGGTQCYNKSGQAYIVPGSRYDLN